jgi:hypothetical protein
VSAASDALRAADALAKAKCIDLDIPASILQLAGENRTDEEKAVIEAAVDASSALAPPPPEE